MKFCERLTSQLPNGWRCTLPTEAQWEYACRAGTKTRYSFGDDEPGLGNYAWFDRNGWNAHAQYAHLIGRKTANPFGLYDMHGNVWEWCCDYCAEKLTGGTDPRAVDRLAPRVPGRGLARHR